MNATTAAGDATANVAADVDPRSFKTFAECRPFDLGEHRNRTCRRLRFVGSTLERPLYSLIGDRAMCGDIRRGRIPF